MPGPFEQRPCGEALRGSHSAHLYMQNCRAYQCPGGAVLHDFPPGEVKFADVQATLDAVWQQGEWQSAFRANAVTAPCPEAGAKAHDAHYYLSADGPACCPGWSEPDDGPGPQPGEPPTDAERIRGLEYTIQRAREALGAEAPATVCGGHEARIAALEDALRDVLAHFVHTGHPGEPCKQTGWVRVATIDQWHAVLRGEAS